jgi:hydrogenase nickel incorporation protein HypA/HybF
VHELGIALELVDIVSERAAGARVKRVVVEVGVLTAVLPDALDHAFGLVCEGTPLAGAALDIVAEPARGRCRACALESKHTSLVVRCACGAWDFEWLSGSELRVRELEVA